MNAPARLPGIAVEPLPRDRAPALPPMDVAGFAGFAARGPCHRAIAVDSVASFAALFGGEVTLAAGRDGQADATSRLAGAVRGFFANGGRKCWVVRLARTEASEAQWEIETGRAPDQTNLAEAGLFPLPGVLQRLPWQAGGESSRLRPAWLSAASLGSWSDGLGVAVRIKVQPFALANCAALPGTPDNGAAGLSSAQIDAYRALHAGVEFSDPGGLAAGDLVEFSSVDGSTRRFARVIRLFTGKWQALWCGAFAPAGDADSEVVGQCQFVGHPALHDATFNARLGRITLAAKPEPPPPIGSWIQFAANGNVVFLHVDRIVENTIFGEANSEVVGKCQFVGHPARPDATFNAKLGRITLAAKPERPPPIGSWVQFAASGNAIFLRADRIGENTIFGEAWRQVPNHVPGQHYSARKVAFDCRTALDGQTRQLDAIGAGFVGSGGPSSLISDDAWFAPRERRRAVERFALCLRGRDRAKLGNAGLPDQSAAAFAAAAARFGTLDFTAADRELLRACWLPLGCGTAFGTSAQALPSARRSLQRDGLSNFDEALFIDPAFVALSTQQVGAALAQHRDVAERQLFGIHALLDTPDTAFGLPTILAAPDMAQPGWELDVVGGLPRAQPLDPGNPISWHSHTGGCLPQRGLPKLDAPDFARFLDCGTRLLAAPDLSGPVTPVHSGEFTLRWTGGEPGVPVELEQSSSPDFAASARIYQGTDAQYALSGLGQGAWYFRLRCADGSNVSAWSVHAVVVRPSDYAVLPGINFWLVRLQLALLRAAAGSLDNVALLSLPKGLRAREAAAQTRLLSELAPDFARPDKLGPQEGRTLSYGAVYHGWLLYRAAPGGRDALLAAPPEGCIAGQMAELARSQGAWIAPANRAFADCAGVDPLFAPQDRLALQEARINALAPIVRGFAAGDAMTLSQELEWGQLNVRRLMIFLRLVALRRGEPLVFESNGDTLRRALERDFSQMLGEMQLRGAFAGGKQGWRLAIQTSQADRDNGRIVAEIGVAPSQPLRFLTFRLVQQGARLTLAEAA